MAILNVVIMKANGESNNVRNGEEIMKEINEISIWRKCSVCNEAESNMKNSVMKMKKIA